MNPVAPDMPIKALAPWFGGKRNLAPLIVQELGRHHAYWEPFCGSMAVLLAKPPARIETVNDLHELLIDLAIVVADPAQGPELYRQLRRTLMHEDFFAESDRIIRELESEGPELWGTGFHRLTRLQRAYHYFVASWLGRNGTAGMPASHTGTYCVRYTAKGGHAATRWQSAIRSIPAWRRRLSRVTILRRDAFELLERIEDAPGVAVYVDPPHLVKGASYLHDFAAGDHRRLADLLARFRAGRIVVSYYDHPDLADLYPPDRWSRVRITVNKAMAHAGRRGVNQTQATEVLLVNGPSYSQPMEAPSLWT